MVTVYVWNAHYAHGSAGHASLAVTGGQPPGTAYISWWPEKRNLKTITVGVRRGVHARLADDELSTAEGRKPDHTVRLEGLDETSIKSFWTRSVRHGEYQGVSHNCATTVARALEAGGGDHYAPKQASHLVWMPLEVLHFALAIHHGLRAR